MRHSFPPRLKAVTGLPLSEQPFRSRWEPSDRACLSIRRIACEGDCGSGLTGHLRARLAPFPGGDPPPCRHQRAVENRSEEHTSELQSLMRISYAVFCLKKKKNLMYS